MKVTINKEGYPEFLTAGALQAMGFSRTMSYALMNREDLPTFRIGKRKFIRKETFFKWLENQESANSSSERDPQIEEIEKLPNIANCSI